MLFVQEKIQGRITQAVQGSYEPTDALRKLLDRSGLTFKFVNPRTVTISISQNSASTVSYNTQGVAGLTLAQNTGKNLESSVVDSPNKVASAQADSASSSRSSRRSVDTSDASEVLVTGSRLSKGSAQGPQPIRRITREEIARTGAVSVSQVLNRLTEVSVQSTTSPFQNSRGNSSVQLRGLPGGLSLILLNGRRLVGTPFQASSGAFNLNLLPISAVERIEVLPAGSSAIYGGDALAGVINVVLRERIDGAEVNLRYGAADGYDERQGALAVGKTFERGSVSFLGSFGDNSELLGFERDITASNDYTRFGGHNASVNYTNPGNVFSLNGANLPGLNSTFAAVPKGSTGIGLTPADFLATQGTQNRDSTFYANAPQLPVSKLYSGILRADFSATEKVSLFTELLFSHYEAEERDYEQYIAGQYGLWRVPAANPFNPFGVDVGVNYLFEGAGRWCFCLQQEYYRPLVGAKGDIAGWQWEMTASVTRGEDRTDEGPALGLTYEDLDRTNAALADPNPATSLNVFADRSDWTLAELAPLGTHRKQALNSELRSFDAFIRGSLFTWSGGTAQALLGFEATSSKLEYNFFITSFSGDRDTRAAFTELRVPLLPGEGVGAEKLVLTGALRYDNYSDFGERTSPQAGIEFRPLPSLLLRAAYGSAYKPPTLYNLFAPLTFYPANPITDPSRGGATYGVTMVQGGNPDLQPLTGESTTAGFVFTPQSLPGFELAMSHWSIKIDKYATTLPSATMLQYESLFGQYITRESPTAQDIANGFPGRVTELRNVYLNFGTFELAGVDMNASWRVAVAGGELRPSLSISRAYKYDAALVPGVPAQDRLGKAYSPSFAPEWKSVAGLRWSSGPLDVSLTGRYVGSYEDYAQSTRELGDFWLMDVNARYDLSNTSMLPGVLRNSSLTVGAVNLFDKLPEYSYYFGTIGYDPSQYDIRGRFIYAQLGVQF